MTVVVDARIAIKWFVPENPREPALNLLQTEEHVAVPDLLISDLTGLVLKKIQRNEITDRQVCLLYTSPSPRDGLLSRMPSSA